ncbi:MULTISPECIES: hypothetical protein [Pseudoalteromonas]|uniref:hypothetical protein n=1 Tax=Pseudoalteromonas TaxID=53246 RepID=UPI000FFEF769|nr:MULTISPECIES: hypothetical protein [unclassified Pseudoalteromonas]MCG9760934.1 hypothetical protein [Pseudoalteromonas sp. Isolate6]RXE87299.1 hypothetical protein DRB05_08405 [Pseudoalteromonas sp. A757]TMN36914.1 hypothetical protein CWC03_13210 [Pseudoalteromonas sp. S2755]
MIKKIVIIFSLLFASSHGSADELKPFTSDGCSAFPDGTLAQNELWLSCCTAHDLAYWKGGTAIERENADIALQKCVAAVGQEEVATLMLAGVRLGGLPYFPTPFRWGYGWSYPRRYAELTAEEIEQVNKHMAKLALDKK